MQQSALDQSEKSHKGVHSSAGLDLAQIMDDVH